MMDLGEKPFITEMFEFFKDYPRFSVKKNDVAQVTGFGTDSIAFKIDRGPSAVSRKFGLSGYEVDGRLAATACVSDLAAVGAIPQSLMVMISAPPEIDKAALYSAIEGILEVCQDCSVDYVGGDTKAGPWMMAAAGIGRVPGSVAPRRAARIGDDVIVSGQIGYFTAGVLGAMGLVEVDGQDIFRSICNPRPMIGEARAIYENCDVSSATDASDGVFEALENLCPPRTGVLLEESAIPFSRLALDVCGRLDIPLLNLLSGGGDWNIVASVRPGGQFGDTGVTRIGAVVPKPGVWLRTVDGRVHLVQGMVSDHFLGRIEDPEHYLTRLRRHDPTGVSWT